MLYHAHALAAAGVDVDLVGFEGTPVPKAIGSDPRITIHRLNPATLRRGAFSGSTYVVAGLLDAARLSFRLWRVLRALPQPNLVLAQNPPAFPTLLVSWLSLRRRGVRFVIDWHNLGFTLLRLRLGQWHPAVRFARWFERRDARRARRTDWRPRSFPSIGPSASAFARRCSRVSASTPALSASSCARRAGPKTRISI
jgi:beta-1,4-mannosyltransferase